MDKTKFSISKALIVVALVLLTIFTLSSFNKPISVQASFESELSAKGVVLIERSSQKVLYEKMSHERLPIASVTKLMTILLTLEEIEKSNISTTDLITISKNANAMGGSQIFLDADVKYELGQLLKSVIVASANDSSVAIAEYIAGSESNFVRLMNDRARELNMHNTNYSNSTGLPSIDGYSTAYDQALLLNKVLNYDLYHEYSSIWLEDFVHPSGRTTEMTNTNKLSRFYEGCIGGKTGSTNQAKYCLAVGAKRNNMELIAVVLGADNSKDRFKLSTDLLNYGFDNFISHKIFTNQDLSVKTIKIKGQDKTIALQSEKEYSVVLNKNEKVNYNLNFNLPSSLKKVTSGEIVGNVEIVIDGIVVETIDILSTETVHENTVWDYFKKLM